MSVPSVPGIWIRPKVTIATNTLRFRWYAPQSSGGSQVTSYRLSSPQDPSSPYTIPSTELGYNVNNLTPGTAYTYSLVAVNSFGSSPSATFRTVYVGPVPPQVASTLVAVKNSSDSVNIVNCFRSGLSSFNIGWIVSKTNILVGSGISYKNAVQFPQSTIFINNNQYVSNNLNLTGNNMYTFDVTYVNDSGSSTPVKTNPLGNVQYSALTTVATTYPYIGNNFNSIASSTSGIIMVTGANSSGFLWATRNRGVTWVQASGPGAGAWNTVACSSDGTKMIAADASPGYIWTSSDSGVTWTRRDGPGSRAWAAVGISFDGTKAVAAAPNVIIYTSSDSGVTWATPSATFTLASYSGITISNDGTTLFAAEFDTGGVLWKSSNSGSTWTSITNASTGGQLPASPAWRGLRMFADKTTLYLANAAGGRVHLSYDGGIGWASFSDSLAAGPYTGINISSNFLYRAVSMTSNNNIFYTTNGGSTWNTAKFNGGTGNWTGLTGDPTGQYLTAISTSGTKTIWYSNTYGEFWYTYANPGSYPWTGVTMSQDATKIVVSAIPSYMSDDGGVNWRMINYNNGATTAFNGLAIISTDNNIIVNVVGSGALTPPVYISRDSGYSWTQLSGIGLPNSVGYTCIAGSSDCSVILIGLQNGNIYLSTNSAASFAITGATTPGTSTWNALASNSSGSQMIAASGNWTGIGYVWITRNTGTTWTQLSSPIGNFNWTGAASDSTGQYLYLCSGNGNGSNSVGYIWASSNYGVTWTQCAGIPNANWSSIRCTPYGNNVIACVNNAKIWTSSDFGVTWYQQTADSSQNWLSIACSSNARSIVGITSGNPLNYNPVNGVIKLTQLTG